MLAKTSFVPLGAALALAMGIFILLFEDSQAGNETAETNGDNQKKNEFSFELVTKDGTALGEKLEHLNAADVEAGFALKVDLDLTPAAEKIGLLKLQANGIPLPPDIKIESELKKNTKTKEVSLNALDNRGPTMLGLIWKRDPDESKTDQHSKKIRVALDATPPVVDGIRLVGEPGSVLTLQVFFREADLKPETALNHTNYSVQRIKPEGGLEEDLIGDQAKVYYNGGNVVNLVLGAINVGTYQLIVKGGGPVKDKDDKDKTVNNTPIIDQFGNPMAADAKFHFSSAPEAEAGPRIEFPEFLPPRKSNEQQKFNPSAHVETRVARMYYFRDAHRVAQIINRIVRSYNRAAVDLAQRRAEDARVDADKKTDERRERERAAVRAAEETRRSEHELQQSYLDLQSLRRRKDQLQTAKAEKDKAAAPADKAQTNEPETPLQQVENQITETQRKISSLEGNVAAFRQNENKLNEEAISSQAREDRAREDQFRKHVSAEQTDPDTYAPAKTDSIDPVMQVSVSVIGEGVLQLRGPIKGINKIRHMINQIDAPVGQVKVGINTVQVNGERGERMEKVVGRIEGDIDLGRFLTAHSLMLFRRAIQIEASRIAQEFENGQHYQVDRDRKYLYAFFGRDFIDELYEMDSEFLRSENKLLSLHSMDTISLHRAMFVFSLAKGDVRQRILENFLQMAKTELPAAEYDFRRASELAPHKTPQWIGWYDLPWRDKPHIEAKAFENAMRNAQQRYHFRHLSSFFATEQCTGGDEMTPAQRQMIKLAQIHKATLVSEVELKQRIVERGLIEDDRNLEIDAEEKELMNLRRQFLEKRNNARETQFQAGQDLVLALATAQARANETNRLAELERQITLARSKKAGELGEKVRQLRTLDAKSEAAKDLRKLLRNEYESFLREHDINAETQKAIRSSPFVSDQTRTRLDSFNQYISEAKDILQKPDLSKDDFANVYQKVRSAYGTPVFAANDVIDGWKKYISALTRVTELINSRDPDWNEIYGLFADLKRVAPTSQLRDLIQKAELAATAVRGAKMQEEHARRFLQNSRSPLDHKKLLDFLIDEYEEKYIELQEGTRAHIATVDNYLKRLSIALEDDFKVQFYDPAFIRIREAAREWDVTLGAVERTTILTNNRALAIVSPTATMEFDLPKRDIAIVEAMEGARALVQDYGALLKDPTFLSAYQLMGGGPQAGKVKNILPGLPTATDEHAMGLTDSQTGGAGSALQSLVPDPSIYKIETGTGFTIRPVIQPDGDSIVYDFNYMYTTDIREPVRADEKHLGRVKRHFINTQVQTSSFELREISRYLVALKAARTAKGVPMFEDIPVLGILFRPLPSDESSIQQNIILGESTVYPTLFDLMGLRWARHVVDLDHVGLRDMEHVVRGRSDTITDYTFDRSASRLDETLGIETDYPEHYRPDLYHRQRQASPYHPGGYNYGPHRGKEDDHRKGARRNLDDPTGREFRIPDRRPDDIRQQPPYDDRFRTPYRLENVPETGPARSFGPAEEVRPIPGAAEPKNMQESTPEISPLPHGVNQQSARPRSSMRQNNIIRTTYEAPSTSNQPRYQVRRLPPVNTPK